MSQPQPTQRIRQFTMSTTSELAGDVHEERDWWKKGREECYRWKQKK
jgi:hypothetical protein